MGKATLPMIAFNRGLVSKLGLARSDIKRIALSAEVMTNWVPRVLGSMSIRPGMGYKGTTKSNATARLIEFVFSTSDKALLELTDSVMRVWKDDALITRPSVSTAVSNGTFTQYTTTCTISNASPGVVTYVGADNFANDDPVTFTTTGALPDPLVVGTTYYVKNVNTGANTYELAATAGSAAINTTTAGSGTHTVGAYNAITGWADNDQSGASSSWVSPGYLGLTGTGTNAAIRDQQVTVAGADQNDVHALRIVITRGPVTIRVGSTSGGDQYISETALGTGTHSLAFTPTGDFYIRFLNRLERVVYVDSCTIEAAGTMELPTPWPAASLDSIRTDQSADVVFCACSGYQQRRIERRNNDSWSVVLYQPEDGPFRVQNTGPMTMAPSVLNGNGTLTASTDYFNSEHVGALFAVSSTGQTVQQTVAALNDVTDSVLVSGIGVGRYLFVTLASLTGTGDRITLQRSTDNATWANTSFYWTTNQTNTLFNDGLDNQLVYYRLKCTVYAAGNPDISLRTNSGSIRGVCRVTAFTSSTVVDMEVLNDFGNTTASDTWQEGKWSDYRGWPTAVCFYEGRLWWSGKDAVDGSVSDAFSSFDDETIGDSGPISRTIGGAQVDTIRWMLGLQRLIIGGTGAEYSCKSSSFDEILTPTNFNPKKASTQGSANVRAIPVDNQGIFVQRGGTRVYTMALGSDNVVYDYTATNLTQIVPEIGDPGIVRIAIQRQPDTRIHCVRSDGTVAMLVFDAIEQVTCWVEIETDGDVEDVAVLPGDSGDNEDWVYYIVKRTINGSTVRYLEKWAFEDVCHGDDLCYLADSFVAYDGAPATTISGLSHLEGEQVVVWADGADVGTASDGSLIYTVASGAITLTTAASKVVVGLPYTAQFQSGKLLSLQTPEGTALSHVKSIRSMGLIMINTHAQGIKYGVDFTTLDDMPGVEHGAPVDPDYIWTEYDQNKFNVPGNWDTDERLCLQAKAPRPVTVSAAVLDVETT